MHIYAARRDRVRPRTARAPLVRTAHDTAYSLSASHTQAHGTLCTSAALSTLFNAHKCLRTPGVRSGFCRPASMRSTTQRLLAFAFLVSLHSLSQRRGAGTSASAPSSLMRLPLRLRDSSVVFLSRARACHAATHTKHTLPLSLSPPSAHHIALHTKRDSLRSVACTATAGTPAPHSHRHRQSLHPTLHVQRHQHCMHLTSSSVIEMLCIMHQPASSTRRVQTSAVAPRFPINPGSVKQSSLSSLQSHPTRPHVTFAHVP